MNLCENVDLYLSINHNKIHLLSLQVVTPTKVGDVYIYDQPSCESQDYDQPPSRDRGPDGQTPTRGTEENVYDSPKSQNESELYDTPKHSRNSSFASNRSFDGMYESPPSNKPVPGLLERRLTETSGYGSPLKKDESGMETYDVLPPQANIPVGVYDRPRSNRSSTISMRSTGSTVSSSNCSGSSLSSRSSSDIQPLDFYDTPPPRSNKRDTVVNVSPPQNVAETVQNDSPKDNVANRDSVGHLMEDYDALPPTSKVDETDVDYDVPKSNKELPKQTQSRFKYRSTENLLHKFDSSEPNKEVNNKSWKRYSAGDMLEDYDTPVSNTESNRSKLFSSTNDSDFNKPGADKKALTRSRSADLLDSGSSFCDTYDVLPEGPKSRAVKSANMDSLYDNSGVQLRLKGTRVDALKTSQSVDQTYDVPVSSRESSLSTVSMRSDSSSRPSSSGGESRGSDIPPIFFDELELTSATALEVLSRLHQDLSLSVTQLLNFVNSSWRKEQCLKSSVNDIKLTCYALQKNLQEFVKFGQGALANSAKAEDKRVMRKMIKHLEPLQDSFQLVQKAIKSLDGLHWEVSKLSSMASLTPKSDHLGMVVGCCKDLPNLTRMLATVIQGNAKLLFTKTEDKHPPTMVKTDNNKPKPPVAPKPSVKRESLEHWKSMQERPLPSPPVSKPTVPTVNSSSSSPSTSRTVDYYEDKIYHEYDYVSLQSPNEVEQRTKDSTPEKLAAQDTQSLDAHTDGDMPQGLSSKFRERIEKLQKAAENQVVTHGSSRDSTINDNNGSQSREADRQILKFYLTQAETHSKVLTDAIDAFFSAVDYNQPPKVFIAHSKFVILAAHKLVYIGDTIHRNVKQEEIRSKVMQCANHLCDCLKVTVTVTKTAALQFPALTSVQDMVDRVVDVSHAAHELILAIDQAATS